MLAPNLNSFESTFALKQLRFRLSGNGWPCFWNGATLSPSRPRAYRPRSFVKARYSVPFSYGIGLGAGAGNEGGDWPWAPIQLVQRLSDVLRAQMPALADRVPPRPA